MSVPKQPIWVARGIRDYADLLKSVGMKPPEVTRKLIDDKGLDPETAAEVVERTFGPRPKVFDARERERKRAGALAMRSAAGVFAICGGLTAWTYTIEASAGGIARYVFSSLMLTAVLWFLHGLRRFTEEDPQSHDDF
jgi:hypothetical protein